MSSRFLITGLPRSRTAWMSVAASSGNAICHHEPTASLQSFDDLVGFWKIDRPRYVGISDSALGFQLERILDVLGPKTLIIERNIDDVRESFLNYFFEGQHISRDTLCRVEDYLQHLSLVLQHIPPHPLVRRVRYEDLSNRILVQKLLEWMMPDNTFPNLRNLMHMKIEVEHEYCVETAARPHSHWYLEHRA